MKPGDVVLTAPPQFDGQVKLRPAVVLCLVPPFNDPLVCGVSTQLHQEVRGLDDLIAPGDVDFAMSGLKAPSIIRLCYINVVMPQRIAGITGNIADERLKRLLNRAATHFAQLADRIT